MENKNIILGQGTSISELHKILGLAKPQHPLISLIDLSELNDSVSKLLRTILPDFFKIYYRKAIKEDVISKQNYYDFYEGELSFFLPNQEIVDHEGNEKFSGFILFFHRDFIPEFSISTISKAFHFFSYSSGENIFLSEKEKKIVFSIIDNIKYELNNRIDKFSQKIFASDIKLLLNYGKRFYERQFITRAGSNRFLIMQIVELLSKYFKDEKKIKGGMSEIEYLADNLNYSSQYLTDLLYFLTEEYVISCIYKKLIRIARD